MNLHATQDKALESYFDALLFAEDGSLFEDAEEVSPLFSLKNKRDHLRSETNEKLNNFQSRPLTYQAEPAVETITVAEASSSVAPVIEEAPAIIEEEPVNVVQASVAAVVNPVAEDNNTDERFLFVRPITVVGLKLAITMESITDVLSAESVEIHRVSHKNGVYATLHYRHRDIPVLDTAALVIPANHPRRAGMLARKNYQYILVLDDGRFAVAVDAMDEQVYLPTDTLRRSETATQYSWLAGTWSDYGYALVDTGKLLNCI